MISVCAALLGLALVPQQKEYSLVWTPKLGQVVDYKLSVSGKVDDEQQEGEGKLHVVVRGATDSHGYSLLCDLTNQSHKTSGEADESPEDVMGVWMESDSEEDPDAAKFEDFETTAGILVASFGEKKRKVGDSWQMSWGGEIQSYKMVAVETVSGTPACKMTMSTGPADAREEDTFWIRISDGLVVRCEEHTTGKEKDDEGKEYTYDQTYTMVLTGESTYSTKATTEDLKVLDKVGPQLKCLSALSNPAQWTTGNYDPTFHEYRDVRVIVLKPKLSVDGIVSDGLPKNSTITCEVSKDGKRVSATIETPDSK